jgi:hypothetical protein
MTPTTLTSRVGPDGVLTVTVPFTPADANQEVKLTIEPVESRPPMTQEEWRQWVESMAGSITDPSFRRHEQGEFEHREELP